MRKIVLRISHLEITLCFPLHSLSTQCSLATDTIEHGVSTQYTYDSTQCFTGELISMLCLPMQLRSLQKTGSF